jgi:hypothetical protein
MVKNANIFVTKYYDLPQVNSVPWLVVFMGVTKYYDLPQVNSVQWLEVFMGVTKLF